MEKLLFELTALTNPSDAIAKLKKEGLSERVANAMDVIRVTGNKALHGYQIVEDAENAAEFPQLAQMMSLIVEQCISQPKREDAIFQALPADAQEQIARRNAKNS